MRVCSVLRTCVQRRSSQPAVLGSAFVLDNLVRSSRSRTQWIPAGEVTPELDVSTEYSSAMSGWSVSLVVGVFH